MLAVKCFLMTVLSSIIDRQQSSQPMLAVLVDPDKPDAYQSVLPYLRDVDLVLVGGSTGEDVDACVSQLRCYTSSPIVLFPGNVAQFTPLADAILFLSLLNSRRPEILIEPHLQSALAIRQSGVESIPMGYILIDGGSKSSVEIVSNCIPLGSTDVQNIVRHAVAAELLGKRLIYLEAGSGATSSVPVDVIMAVREAIDLPLIVGGGIASVAQMLNAYDAGANIVVIGNYFECFPEHIPMFVQAKKVYGKS